MRSLVNRMSHFSCAVASNRQQSSAVAWSIGQRPQGIELRSENCGVLVTGASVRVDVMSRASTACFASTKQSVSGTSMVAF